MDITRDKFMAKVEVVGIHWIWQGPTEKGKYGLYTERHYRRLAHHVAWELEHGGPIPTGHRLVNGCHVPLCISPACWALLSTSTANAIAGTRSSDSEVIKFAMSDLLDIVGDTLPDWWGESVNPQSTT